MHSMDVVAMTTTGASKFKDILKKLDSKVMIIEEAAEILESHVITSFIPSLKHIVLIGDHKQLRPKAAFNLIDLNLDLSLFERLINNGFQNVMLKVQRRMRPEISELVREIYPKLKDDPSTFNRENIRGLNDKNYLFFTHTFPEQSVVETLSK